jgi:predicted Na+-dependent transporter
MHSHHHSRHQANLRLERWHRRLIYLVLTFLFGSGLAWLVARYFLRPVGTFGETIHPLEPWAMKLHGAAAMAALFFVGSLMNAHIRRAIKNRRNLLTGWSLIAVLMLLVGSGFGLYYLAGESDRALWSTLHWVPGLALLLVFLLHLVCGRRSRQPR